jgi:MOSC domain-containing protein
MTAQLEAICIAAAAGAPMQSLSQVEAVPGVGLAADRYARGVGFYSGRPTDPGAREVTLFEAEVLDDLGIPFTPTEHRRNLTTRGIRLADLIGRRFQIGQVTLEGIRDCPPCEHLEQVTSKPVLRPLLGRSGIRARVIHGGLLRVGDAITPITSAEPSPATAG